MKKLAAIFLLASALCVRADMVISETIEANGSTQPVTLKVKGDKIRTDIADQMSTITDASTGDVITIMHAQKVYLKMSSDKTKELVAKMQAMQGASPSPTEKPKITSTGRKEKVNNYDTEVFTSETPTMKFTYWIVKDFPNGAAIKEQMKKIQASMQSKMGVAANSVPDTTAIDGLPLKTQIVMNGQTMTTTLISAKDAPVADADLAVPAGYSEMQMPSGAPQ